MPLRVSWRFGAPVPWPSAPGYPNLMGKYTTSVGSIVLSRYLTIKASESGMLYRRTLPPCGKHLVFVQCLLRPTRRWYARVRALHSGECIVPLVVPLEEV
jgi:hypothetical protein